MSIANLAAAEKGRPPIRTADDPADTPPDPCKDALAAQIAEAAAEAGSRGPLGPPADAPIEPMLTIAAELRRIDEARREAAHAG